MSSFHNSTSIPADGAFWGTNSTLYAATALVAVLVGWMFTRYSNSNKLQDHQMPPAAPPHMGLIPYLTQLLGTKGPQFALANARKHGYVTRTPGSGLFWFSVGEPHLARHILEDSASQKPPLAYQVFTKALSGPNFFTSNGPRAMHVRKSTAAAFSAQNVKNMEVVVDQVLEQWIADRLEPLYVQANKAIDFDEEMMIVTTDIIARAGFHYNLTHDERMEFADKMRFIMDVFFHQNLSLPRKFFPFLYSDIRQAQRLAQELVQAFGHKFLQACRNDPRPDQNSVVYLMLQDDEYDKDGSSGDDQRARDILIYFFAGFETTAHSIAWTMLELAKSPKEQTKLRTALSATTTEDIKSCPQLKNVTREVLRLHTPAALGSTRLAARDIKVPRNGKYINGSISKGEDKDDGDELVIPKGSFCSLIYYMILRNHHVFGENADDFVPSRWEDPTEDMLKAYLPFAAGKRNCQGMALAYLELNTVVARLVSSYQLQVEDEGEAYYMIALRPKGSKVLLTKL